MRIKTLRTIEQRDKDGAVDRYHGGLEFDVSPVLAAEWIDAGLAVDPNAPEPEPEPEPAEEQTDESGDLFAEEGDD